MDIHLVLDSGKQKGRETPLSLGVYLVGRSKDCQIRPKSKLVSRKHCALIHNREGLLVQDIGSKHGTFVNRKRLEQGVAVAVADGDTLQVGGSRFRFAISAPEPTAELPPVQATDGEMAGEKKARRKSNRKSLGRLAKPKIAVEPRAADSPASARDSEAASDLRTNGGIAAESLPKTLGEAHPGADAKKPSEHVIDDILQLLKGDDSEIDGYASGINIGPDVEAGEVDLEGEAEDDVEFAAPRSSESLPEETELPSYQLSQDWDVNSVHNWVGQKQSAPTPPAHKFKLKKGTKAQKAAEKEREKRIRKISGAPERRLPAWLDWTESGVIAPIIIALFGLLLLAWVAYNVYLLVVFKG